MTVTPSGAVCIGYDDRALQHLSGLITQRDELAKYQVQLEADIRALTVDIDHLETAIRIFDPDNTPAARRRYAALHRTPRGQSTRLVLRKLREV